MTGTKCESCEDGHLVVYCSRRINADEVLQYFHCWLCSSKPENNRRLAYSPQQTSRLRTRSSTTVPPDDFKTE